MAHPTSGERVAVELCEGLPVHELHARLLLCLELQEVGNRGLAFYLADMHDRGLHQTTGHSNTAHFAACRLEISRSQAYELIKVGRALRELPAIDLAFCEGRLSWSKVGFLVRVATPEHEQAWLAKAQATSCKELRLAVRLAKHGSAPRKPGETKGLPEIRYDIRARVDVLAHREIELAREKLSAERGEPIDDAGLLSIAAKLILGSDDNGELPERERIDGSLYRIVLHARAGAEAGEGDSVSLDTPDVESLAAIARERGRREGACIDEDASHLLAEHARGTPRTVVHLTLGTLDRAASRPALAGTPHAGQARGIGLRDARDALQAMGYDRAGFTPLDRRYLATLRAQPGPVALRRLAAMLGIGASTLLDCVEPFLASRGLVGFTPRGRIAAAPLRCATSG